MKIVNKLYDNKISSKGLAVFRILFSLNLLMEVFQRFLYRNLYYDIIPFVQKSILSHSIIWGVWVTVLMMLIIGFKTRLAAVLNYVFVLAFIVHNNFYEYHMDYSYAGISFLMMIVPLSNSLSIDRLLLKLKYSSKNNEFSPPQITSKLYYYLLLLVGIGFVYFDSIFFKFSNVGWKNGLGMWLPASLPQITILEDQWLLNQKYLIIGLGYLTIAFELFFPFLFWIKKIRIPFLIIGLGLHFGILVEFPIPFFALGVIAIYLLLLPLKYWDSIINKIKFSFSKIEFFYDQECPLCQRTVIILKHFDWLGAIDFKSVQAHGVLEKKLKDIDDTELLNNIYSIDNKGYVRSGIDTYIKIFKYIPILFFVGCFLKLPGVYLLAKRCYTYIALNRNTDRCAYDTCEISTSIRYVEKDDVKILKNYSVKNLKIAGLTFLVFFLFSLQLNTSYSTVSKLYEVPYLLGGTGRNMLTKAKFYLGITKHGVFVDNHFKNFDKVYALKYKNEFLPIIDEKGMPGKYLQGGRWVNHNWRVNGPKVNIKNEKSVKRLEKGLGRFANFWAVKNRKINPNFTIVEKRMKVTFEWEKDLLKNNINSPWIEVGKAFLDSETGQLKFVINE